MQSVAPKTRKSLRSSPRTTQDDENSSANGIQNSAFSGSASPAVSLTGINEEGVSKVKLEPIAVPQQSGNTSGVMNSSAADALLLLGSLAAAGNGSVQTKTGTTSDHDDQDEVGTDGKKGSRNKRSLGSAEDSKRSRAVKPKLGVDVAAENTESENGELTAFAKSTKSLNPNIARARPANNEMVKEIEPDHPLYSVVKLYQNQLKNHRCTRHVSLANYTFLLKRHLLNSVSSSFNQSLSSLASIVDPTFDAQKFRQYSNQIQAQQLSANSQRVNQIRNQSVVMNKPAMNRMVNFGPNAAGNSFQAQYPAMQQKFAPQPMQQVPMGQYNMPNAAGFQSNPVMMGNTQNMQMHPNMMSPNNMNQNMMMRNMQVQQMQQQMQPAGINMMGQMNPMQQQQMQQQMQMHPNMMMHNGMMPNGIMNNMPINNQMNMQQMMNNQMNNQAKLMMNGNNFSNMMVNMSNNNSQAPNQNQQINYGGNFPVNAAANSTHPVSTDGAVVDPTQAGASTDSKDKLSPKKDKMSWDHGVNNAQLAARLNQLSQQRRYFSQFIASGGRLTPEQEIQFSSIQQELASLTPEIALYKKGGVTKGSEKDGVAPAGSISDEEHVSGEVIEANDEDESDE